MQSTMSEEGNAMSHSRGSSDGVPPGIGPLHSGFMPYGSPPGYPGAPVPPATQGSPSRLQGRGRLVAVVAVTVLFSAVIGGLAGGGLVAASRKDTGGASGKDTGDSVSTAAPAQPPTQDQIHAA